MMPVMDGITMLKNIKGNSNINDIPVILLTSKSEVDFRLEGLKKAQMLFSPSLSTWKNFIFS